MCAMCVCSYVDVGREEMVCVGVGGFMPDAFFKALISITDEAATDKAKQVWTSKSKHRQTEIIPKIMN